MQGKTKKGLEWKDESTAKSKGNPHAFIRFHAKKGSEKIYLSQEHVRDELVEKKK